MGRTLQHDEAPNGVLREARCRTTLSITMHSWPASLTVALARRRWKRFMPSTSRKLMQLSYESLDTMLGRVPSHGVADLQRKLIVQWRGGYRVEQNMLFRAGALPHQNCYSCLPVAPRNLLPVGLSGGGRTT